MNTIEIERERKATAEHKRRDMFYKSTKAMSTNAWHIYNEGTASCASSSMDAIYSAYKEYRQNTSEW